MSVDPTERGAALTHDCAAGTPVPFLATSDGRVSWVSPRVVGAVGRTPAQLIGTRVEDLGYEVTLDRLPDGGYVGTLHTPHTGLDEMRERLNLVVESSRLGTWDWNVQTGGLVVNRRWVQILGYEPQDLEPVSIQTWLDLAHPEDLVAVDGLLAAHAEGDAEFYEMECRMRHRDGHWVWVHDRGRIVSRTNDGQPLRMTGTHQDITDRKQAEQALADSEARYRALVERMADVVVAFGVDGTVTFASPSFTDLLGWAGEEWLGRPALDLVYDPDERDQVVAQFSQMLQNSLRTITLRLRRKDGSACWVEVGSHPQHGPDGEVSGVIVAIREHTPAPEQVAGITEHVGDVVIRLENDVVTWASPSVSQDLGGPPSRWLGMLLAQRVHPEDIGLVEASRRRVRRGQRDRSRLRLRDLSGAYHWVDVVAAPGGGSESTAVLSLRVIDQDVAREATWRRMAESDSLTGLANRRELMNRIASMLCGWRSGRRSAVIFCDVDNLKQINDAHGHQAGDAVLIAVARRLRAAVRPDDVCARFGGDEFVIGLADVADTQTAVGVAERLRTTISEPVAVPGAEIEVTVSMGVAVSRPAETPGPLVTRADQAMYLAKRGGRNRTVVARSEQSGAA